MKYRMFRCIIVFMAACFFIIHAGCAKFGPDVQLQMVERGAYSGITDSGLHFAVISARDHYEEVMARVYAWKHEAPDPPSVDFDDQLLVAVFMGQKPTAGYAVSFKGDAKVKGDALKIGIERTYPSPDDMVAQVITSPYAIAIVERGDYTRVRFLDADGDTLESMPVPGVQP